MVQLIMANQLLKYYRDRWEAVEEIEREENRRSSIQERWMKLNALLLIAEGLNLTDDEIDMEIINRWAKLKGAD